MKASPVSYTSKYFKLPGHANVAILRAKTVKGQRWRNLLAGKSLKPRGMEGQRRDWTTTDTDEQTQFYKTETDLEVHPGLSPRVSEVSRT